jgi:hypothetical protein
MLAVLEEALVTFQRGLRSRGLQQRQDSCEVERWVASTDGESPFSFDNICTSLRIDPGYLREGLKRLKVAARQGQDLHNPHVLRRERMSDRRAWRGRIAASGAVTRAYAA